MTLLDRDVERAALEEGLAGARAGAGGALVLRGEPGIGRTSLLEHAIGAAERMGVARLAGIDSEVGLGFAGLHRLLTPLGSGVDHLPEPQSTALRAAFGLVTADPPDRFRVGLATLALLAAAAADQPLLVAVDDAQWLDHATVEVLAFVARRLATAPITLVITVREPTHRCRPLDGLPTRRLAGLPEEAAHELLTRAASGSLESRAAGRVVAETGGNPLALVEFGRQLTDGRWAAGRPASEPLPISACLKGQFLRGVRTLPASTQTLLLLAAAEPGADRAVLRRAAARLGLGANVAQPAEAAGVLAADDPTTFTNPLIRSAVYHGASPRERRRVHAALAATFDPAAHPDAHAWHRAAAAADPDEAVAGDLALAAARARAAGDHAAEAMLLARAAELTPDDGRRTDRLLDAVAAELAANRPARAETLLNRAVPPVHPLPVNRASADPTAAITTAAVTTAAVTTAAGSTAAGPTSAGPTSADTTWAGLISGRAAHLRATVSLARGRFREAPAALLRAARELPTDQPRRARRTLLDALYAGLVASSTEPLLEIIQAARGLPVETPPTTADLLLDAFATRLTGGHRAASALMRAAVDALVARPDPDESPYLLVMGCWAAGELLDGAAQHALVGRWERATGDGLLGLLVPDPTGVRGHGDLFARAWSGQETIARRAVADSIRRSIESGAGLGVLAAHYAAAVLELALGHYDAALTAALTIFENDPPGLGTYVLPDLVEAAVRGGDQGLARAAGLRLAERVRPGAPPLAGGLLARSQALLSASTGAETFYLEAIERLGQADEPAQLARAHLLYGEWLRRQRRRRDARRPLGTAHDLFDALGLEAFARRSLGELLATGERAAKRTGEATDLLTPQEMQVAGLVAEGSSNRQIAAQLFISPNTVEYHLQKVFRKVGVSSRTQLARALLAHTVQAQTAEAPALAGTADRRR